MKETLEQTAFVELLRTHGRLHDELTVVLKERGLSEPQFNALRALRGAGAVGLPCQEVAERLITRQPDVTRLLDRLAVSGLISRMRSAEDRRVVVVKITAKGIELLARLDRPVARLHVQQLGHMRRRDLRELIRLLEVARVRRDVTL